MSLTGVWGAPGDAPRGIDFALRHKEEAIARMVDGAKEATVKLQGHVFGSKNKDYPRFRPFIGGKFLNCESFVVSRDPPRVGEDVQDYALLEVELKRRVVPKKNNPNKFEVVYEHVAGPYVLINNMSSTQLDVTNSEVQDFLCEVYPDKNEDGTDKNDDGTDESDVSDDETVEEDEFDSYLEFDTSKLLVNFASVDSKPTAK